MGATTITGRVENAHRFSELANKMYIGIAEVFPWSNRGEERPDPDNEKATELINLIGIKRVASVSFAYLITPDTPKPNKEIEYGGKKYGITSYSNAVPTDARFLYVEADIKSDDFPLGKYRQVGLITDAKFKPGITGDAIQAKDIQSIGTLHTIENRKPFERKRGVTVRESMLIEF